MSNKDKQTRYQPYSELTLYPGMQLSAERRRQVDENLIEPDEVSADDIIYKLSRMVTGTLYSLIALMEERWGKEAARELVFQWGRRWARETLERWMHARGAKRLTPELWARFQDYHHLISGPIGAPSFVRYEGDSQLVLNRTGQNCMLHTGRPEGMDSYCGIAADGIFGGYGEVCPELSCEHHPCVSRGTSESDCVVRFTIKPAE